MPTQTERAVGAAAAVRHFASFPNIAGIHWFQYYDEPSGGRGDGENFNMGLVDIHNEPYAGLTAALKQANAAATAVHAASAAARVAAQPAVIALHPAAGPIAANDGSLADWTDKAATRLPWFRVSAPHVPFGDVHMSWSPDGLNLFHLAQNYADLFLLDHEGDFPVSETYQLHLEVDAGAGLRHFVICLVPRPHSKYPGRFELAPQLYAVAAGGSLSRLSEKDIVQVLDKPLPHIALEMRLPARLLGVERLQADMPLTMRISVTTFYREMTMTLGAASRGTAKTDRDQPCKAILADK